MQNNDDKNNRENSENIAKKDKVKVVVSSLKDGEVQTNNNNEKDKNENNNRISFVKSFYYSAIRLDKIDILIAKSKGSFRYILMLLFLISIMMSFSISNSINKKMGSFIEQVRELPEFEYSDGTINADINISFVEEDINRLIIINTTDSLIDIRNEYKEEIDAVDHYMLFSKDTVYAEPGESFAYSEFNFLKNQSFEKEDLIRELNSIYELKLIFIISGFIVSLIIFSFIIIFSFFVGRFLISVFTIFGIRTLSLKQIDRLSTYLTSMPLLVFTILSIIVQSQLFKLPVSPIVIYYSIYLIYIFIAIRILKTKYNQTIVSQKINFIEELEKDRKKLQDMEIEEKTKRERRKRIKDKNRQKQKNEKEKDDEITEGV